MLTSLPLMVTSPPELDSVPGTATDPLPPAAKLAPASYLTVSPPLTVILPLLMVLKSSEPAVPVFAFSVTEPSLITAIEEPAFAGFATRLLTAVLSEDAPAAVTFNVSAVMLLAPVLAVPPALNVTVLPLFIRLLAKEMLLPFAKVRLYPPPTFTSPPPDVSTVKPAVLPTLPMVTFVAVILPSSVVSTLKVPPIVEPTVIGVVVLAEFVPSVTVFGVAPVVPINPVIETSRPVIARLPPLLE